MKKIQAVENFAASKSMVKFSDDSVSINQIAELRPIMKLLDIPLILLSDVIEYTKRNLLYDNKKDREERTCMRCFKAFLIDKSREYKLNDLKIKLFVLSFGGGFIGHNGFYMDGDSIKKLDL
jgi:hypothetical protein